MFHDVHDITNLGRVSRVRLSVLDVPKSERESISGTPGALLAAD